MTNEKTIPLQREAGNSAEQAPRQAKASFDSRRTTANVNPNAAQRPVTPFDTLPPPPPARPSVPSVPPIAPPPLPRPASAPTTPVPPKPKDGLVRPAQPGPDKRGSIGQWRQGESLSGEANNPNVSNAPSDNAFAFSNAAAGHNEQAEAKIVVAREQPAQRPRTEAIELLGFDAANVSKLRKVPALKKFLVPAQPKSKINDDDDGRDKQKEDKDRRDVQTLITNAESSRAQDLPSIVSEALASGALPPIEVISGDMEFLFDEMEALKAALIVIAPFVPGDKKLKESIDVVREVMATPGIERARSVLQSLHHRVFAAFGATNRGIAANYIETQIEPMLLEGRCYQKRTVMGREFIRTSFMSATDNNSKMVLPAYLTTDWINDLPLFRRFSAKIIAEARPRVEQTEAADVALKVLALGRKLGR